MLIEIFTHLTNPLTGTAWVTILASFTRGILSILLSPCHLSSIPLVIGFIDKQGWVSVKRVFSLSLLFATGILITIAVIGIITASLGRLMGDVGRIGNYLVAVVFFLVGLYLWDMIPSPWAGASGFNVKQKGLLAALLVGLIFGIGLGPCTFAYMAPMLGIAFSVAAERLIFAIALLFA